MRLFSLSYHYMCVNLYQPIFLSFLVSNSEIMNAQNTLEKVNVALREERKMFTLRYYCQGHKADRSVLGLLGEVERKQGIRCEVVDLSTNQTYDSEREKQVYERYFKPRAKILKKRTGKSVFKALRSKRARNYFVSIPGTLAVFRDDHVEWYTIMPEEILSFLRNVITEGENFLQRACR